MTTERDRLIDEISDIFTDPRKYADEQLHPDLAPYLHRLEFGMSVQHPLVYDIPLVIPALANRQYAIKRIDLQAAFEQENWYKVIFLHERPYRMWAAVEHELEWNTRLMGEIWTDSENVWQFSDEWRQYFRDLRNGLYGGPDEHLRLMDEDRDLPDYEKLPDKITVYRGAVENVNTDGFSWTMDRQIARFFAQRFAGMHRDAGGPVILTGTVAKDDVLALFHARGETEVVCLPETVSDLKTAKARL